MCNNYEHLLSQDPIGAFEKIKANYIRYFKNAYRISDQELNEERVKLLEKDDNLYKSPYLELLPEYNSFEGINDIGDLADRFEEAFGSLEVSRQFFNDFIKKGLMKYVPYVHQVDMMEKVFCPDGGRFKNAVITTGTGSGKTEAFLLPLFAQLFKEAKTWERVDNNPNWYCRTDRGHRTYYNPCQRETDGLGGHIPSLRALVMYPMNALVEDQMSRLRRALDSDDIRTFMDSEEGLKGNRIYFGSYNGSTIGMKNYHLIDQYGPVNDRGEKTAFNKAREALKNKLRVIHDQFSSVCDYYNSFEDDDAREAKEEVLYTSPRLGGNRATAEMVTRWDMQEWAPDILITNVSMLSIMLMREAERSIFKQTRAWLAAEDLPEEERADARKNRIFHIVLDELHLYRDTAGSETACLIRMLLNAIGLPPVIKDAHGNMIPNPQLRVLASSASLGTADATHKFLEEFFGVYNSGSAVKAFNIIPDESGYCSDYEPERDKDDLDYEKFSIFTNEFVTLEESAKVAKMNELAGQFGCADAVSFIHEYERTIFADFLSMGCKHGVKLDDLVFRPADRTENQTEEKSCLFKSKEALRGFLIFRAYADHLTDENGKPIKHRLPRIRFHQFFKYIEGLWGELNPPAQNLHSSPVRALSYKSQEVGPHNGKVLELLRCECCGELFIGGNRKVKDGHTYLTLNYPSLGTIPNFNPTPMVQNKTFEEYALFWPSESDQAIALPEGNDHMTMQYSNKTSYDETRVRAQWRHAYLDVYTGEVKKDRPIEEGNYIKGFLLETEQYGRQEPDLSLIHALPCCCPHCNQNYTMRRYVKSPIRSFRTGIDRSNQLLSKELIYQLNSNSSKLIGFSDSRQDAAKQALGIEVEHYRDMVRMLFVQSVTEADREAQALVRFIEAQKSTHPRRADMRAMARQHFTNEHIDAIVDAIYDNDPEELRNYISDTISLNSLIGHGNHMDGLLLKKLVALGINPAGPEYKYQQFCEDDGTGERQHWSRAFDFATYCMRDNLQFRDTRNTNDAALNYNTVKNGLSSAIFENSFGKYMGVSTLDAGLGYICCSHTQDVRDSREFQQLDELLLPLGIDTFDFIDAFIRVLGDNYRFIDPDSTLDKWTIFSDFSGNVRKPIETFMERHCFDADQQANLKSRLYDFLYKYVSGEGTVLNFNSLSFKILDPQSDYYICPRCGRVHPNKGFGFCTNSCCLADLSDAPDYVGKVEDLQRNHFISFDILEEPREPRRLHTEELTGQTDNIQERLLNFKDIVLLGGTDARFREGFEASKPIDMVNVTTTMEVGVDIGSLEAIFQGNMPPTRYNYQQRVGRGGRRGQAFSTAVTFCRGRSHDVYYYQKATDRIVGDIPAPPELSLAPFKETDAQGNVSYHMKLAIMKRVIVKELLNKAYSVLPYDYDLKDNCGEFGRVWQWRVVTKTILVNWIAANGGEIDDTVDYYFTQFNSPGVNITQDIDRIKTWIRNDLVSSIDHSLARENDLNKGLAQSLAELGYLPMYGMPSDVREFYHGTDRKFGQSVVNSIDRSSELAISEFAPGSEKTKDKGVYRVEALTLPMDFRERYGRDWLSFFYKDDDPDEEKDALKDRYIITYDHDITQQNHEGNIESIEPAPAGDALGTSRGLGLNQRLIVIPRAYRSNKIFDNNGTPVENSDRSSSFSQCQIWAKDDIANGNIREVRNVRLSVYGLGLNNDAEVWHVNSNNNRFFRGEYAPQLRPDGSGDSSLAPNFTFYNKDRDRDIMYPVSERSLGSFEIALGSRKPTEMVSLELRTCRDELCLDVRDDFQCNVAAVRAAFYSAAFLMQRTLADKLDVQPEEIEISEKRSADCPYPVIYLSDALPNGAGIVSHLAQEGRLEQIITDIVTFKTEFMQSLLDEDHRKICRTACQNCLLSYSNRGYHHVLDWRMGVGILRLMIDPDYDFGFNTDRSQYPELRDYDELIVAAAKKGGVDLQEGEWFTSIQTYGDELSDEETLVGKVYYHPLWDKFKTKEKAALAGNWGENTVIEMYNIFNLLRSNVDDDPLTPRENNDPAHDETPDQGQPAPRIQTPIQNETPGDEIIEL